MINEYVELVISFNPFHGDSVKGIILDAGDVSLWNGDIEPFVILGRIGLGVVDDHGHRASRVHLQILGRRENVHVDLLASLDHDLWNLFFDSKCDFLAVDTLSRCHN